MLVILHLVALLLSFFIFKGNKIFFILSEAFILLSAALAWNLFNELILPLNTLMSGLDAIKERDFNVKFRSTGKYEVDQLVTVYNQMMDELRTERTRQEQQHFFLEMLINTSPTGIIILDFDDKIQLVNPTALQILGICEKPITGLEISEFSHPILQEIKTLPSGESRTISLQGVTTYKLQKSQFIDRGFPRRFVMIEELTAEILEAEKKAYGKVIWMIAHEVNNTIGPVSSILQLALKSGRIWEQVQDAPLKNALEIAVERNQNLNVFMKNFAELVKLPEPAKRELDLFKLVQNIANLMGPRAREKKIEIQCQPVGARFQVFADEQQMEQALINIVKNSIEAIGESGQIILAADPVRRLLTIEDTGEGLPLESGGQIFSPFFSTRKDGQGIGLTLVREILIKHGFEFSLLTIRERETVFTIKF